MDRLTILIKNRLLLVGAPPFEAPYLAREAIAFAREIAITEDADVVRFAVITQELGSVLQASPSDRNVVMAVLLRRDVAPSARFDFIERTWLGRAPRAKGA
jgi:hypothetical protein